MWRKSEVWKNKKFRFLVFLELVLIVLGCIGLIPGDRVVSDLDTMQVSLGGGEYLEETGAYRIDGSSGYQGAFLQAVPQVLSPGVYRMEIYVEAEDNAVNSFEINSTSGKFRGLRANGVGIYAGKELQTCQFYVTGSKEEAVIAVNYAGTGELLVKDLRLVKTNAGSRIFLTMTICLSALADMLVMLYYYMGKNTVERDKKLVWFGIPAIALIASFPIFTDYVVLGVDYIFHCMRIEALAKSICQGIIPARIEPVWMYGHGYANSIFYCDTFLTFPAILRIIGFDMTFAYNSYVFAVNLATALIAYWSFGKIFRSRYVGMFGSLLYTLAPYRIYNIYNRSAVGEYTAMTFLPLLACGFYLIFAKDTEEKEYRHYWLIPALGFTGIIQSHVLSCEIAGAFTILLCVIMIKKVFRKKVFLELVKTVAGTVLLNAWYLVPFLDMTVSGEYYFSHNTGVTVQKRGIQLANIFDTMQAAGDNSRFFEQGLLDTEPIGVGMAILLGVAAWFFARKLLKSRDDKVLDSAAWVSFGVGVAALVMSTSYFPWDAIQSLNSITGTLVPMLQFTTRLTIIPTVCFTFVACVAAWRILVSGNSFVKNGFVLLVCGASVLFSLYQTNDLLFVKEEYLRLYSMENIGTTAALGAEYLPIGADMTFSYHGAVPSDGVTVEDFEKENLDTVTQLAVESSDGEHYVELPLLLYKGYRAEDTETGERFEIIPGNHYDVRVLLPAGYSGTLHTWYAGMWYWRAAEAVSLLGAVVVTAGVILRKREENHQS